MHLFYSGSEVSHALWCRSVRDTSALVPKCLVDTLAPAKKYETLRHKTHGAEMSWVRSVLGPKCPYTIWGGWAKLHCCPYSNEIHITYQGTPMITDLALTSQRISALTTAERNAWRQCSLHTEITMTTPTALTRRRRATYPLVNFTKWPVNRDVNSRMQ